MAPPGRNGCTVVGAGAVSGGLPKLRSTNWRIRAPSHGRGGIDEDELGPAFAIWPAQRFQAGRSRYAGPRRVRGRGMAQSVEVHADRTAPGAARTERRTAFAPRGARRRSCWPPRPEELRPAMGRRPVVPAPSGSLLNQVTQGNCEESRRSGKLSKTSLVVDLPAGDVDSGDLRSWTGRCRLQVELPGGGTPRRG